MKKRLWTAFDRFFSPSSRATNTVQLPQEILGYLAQRNLPPLQNWLQKALKVHPDTPEFPLLLEEAKRAGLPDQDITKLEIFGHYYRGDLTEAFRQAVKYADGKDFDADLFVIAAFSLYHLGNFEDAWQLLKSAGTREVALESRADYAITATLICLAANRLEEVKRYIDMAWCLAPDDPIVALNAYATYFELGEMEAFESVRREYLKGRYPNDRAGFALAVVDLAQDNYEEGFRLLELRYQMAEAHCHLNRGLFDHPRWQGEPLARKVLLVSAEQGLGDTIQMARYLPELARPGPAYVVMESQPETLSLLQYNFPNLNLVERKYGVAPELSFDLWVGAMSLPYLLGTTTTNIPGRAGYLRVPPENADYWRDRVAELARGGRPRIGLAWSGQPTHRSDRRRSIPFSRMMDAVRMVDADFFALQTHVPPVRPANLIDVSEELITLADTAALIAELDWVITVDTSVVHVAGAIGKETWLLLPYRYEWRWSLEGESNHWYDSVSVLRQKTHGDWDTLLHEVFDHRLPERLSAQYKEA